MATFPRIDTFPPPPTAPGGGQAGKGGGGGPFGGTVSFTAASPLTLQALALRQRRLSAEQATPSVESIATPMQGIGYLTNVFGNALQQRAAEQQYGQRQSEMMKIFGGVSPETGATEQQIADIGQIDPDFAIKLWEDRASRLGGERWEPVEGQPGLQRNVATGEIKSTGLKEGDGVKLSDIGSLRDDYVKAANVYESAAPTWQSMQSSYATASSPEAAVPSAGISGALQEKGITTAKGAADYALVVGLAKILDPTSVVREGEVESVRQTGGAADYLIGYLNQMFSKGSLSDDVRRGIMAEAQNRMRAYYDQAKTKRDWITGVAGRHGINPDDVVGPLGEFTEWQTGEQPQQPQQPGGQPAVPVTRAEIDALPRLNGTSDPDLSKLSPEAQARLKTMTLQQLSDLGLYQE